MSLKNIIRALFLGLLLNSCVARKEVVLFENLDQIESELVIRRNNIVIQPDDRITIRVNAQEQEAANPFNITDYLGGANMSMGVNNVNLIPYQVDDDGNIVMPVLGKVKVGGYTILELSDKIEELLNNYLPDATVTVRLDNFQVSVLGEVRNPGTFPVEDDHIALPKALGLAGDITIYGERNKVLVVRRFGDEIQHGYLNLTDANVVNSKFYNLQQNDIVYVEPRSSRRQASGYLNNAPTYLSMASIITSIIVLLTR